MKIKIIGFNKPTKNSTKAMKLISWDYTGYENAIKQFSWDMNYQ